MKAVILAGGVGSRMRAQSEAVLSEEQKQAANAGVKAMVSVGRPFLDHVMSAIADAGFTDICLVIGPDNQLVRDYYDGLETSRVNVSYAVQERPLGTANALLAAEDFADGDPVLVLNSDNYYPSESLRLLAEHTGNAVLGFDRDGLIEKSNVSAEKIATYALLKTDGQGNLVELVEKPTPEEVERFGPDAPISMNSWLLTPEIFDAAKKVTPSKRGELELQTAVRIAMEEGEEFAVLPTDQGVLDLSSRDDVAAVQEALGDAEVHL